MRILLKLRLREPQNMDICALSFLIRNVKGPSLIKMFVLTTQTFKTTREIAEMVGKMVLRFFH